MKKFFIATTALFVGFLASPASADNCGWDGNGNRVCVYAVPQGQSQVVQQSASQPRHDTYDFAALAVTAVLGYKAIEHSGWHRGHGYYDRGYSSGYMGRPWDRPSNGGYSRDYGSSYMSGGGFATSGYSQGYNSVNLGRPGDQPTSGNYGRGR